MTKENISLIQIAASILTPIAVLIVGLVISKRLERNKVGVLKEREWQIKWADLFLNKAIELNSHVSNIVCSYYKLQTVEVNSNLENQLQASIATSVYALQDIGWDIQNFSQFGKQNNPELKILQQQLFSTLHSIGLNRVGDLEEIRKLQIRYNEVARKCHNEILNSNVDY